MLGIIAKVGTFQISIESSSLKPKQIRNQIYDALTGGRMSIQDGYLAEIYEVSFIMLYRTSYEDFNNYINENALVECKFNNAVNMKNGLYAITELNIVEYNNKEHTDAFYRCRAVFKRCDLNEPVSADLGSSLSDIIFKKLGIKTSAISRIKSAYKYTTQGVAKAKETITDITANINEAVSFIQQSTDGITDLLNVTMGLQASIDAVLRTPSLMAVKFEAIQNQLETIGANAIDTKNLAQQILDGNIFLKQSTSNSQYENSIISSSISINEWFIINALSDLQVSICNLDYTSVSDINASLDTIKAYNDKYIDYILSADIKTQINSLAVSCNLYLLRIRDNLTPNYILKNLNNASPHEVAFMYYGSYTDIDKIYNLNPQLERYDFLNGDINLKL